MKIATLEQFNEFKSEYDRIIKNRNAYLKEIEKKRKKLEKDGCRVIIVDDNTMYGIK